jgi:zinc transport system permease protein
MDDFLVRALIGGIGVALVAGPFGSFVVWRRLAYFGDTLAHSALLGVVIGYLLHLNLTLGVIAVCQLLALLLFLLQRRRGLAGDTLLGILAHSALSLGLVLLALAETLRVDLLSYLFGDILAISRADLYWIYGGGGVALVALGRIWRPLLAITVHEDLAQVEGIPVAKINWGFMSLMALAVALLMKVVGLLLVTAMFIIPAATFRRFATTPESMAAGAAGCGIIAVVAGLSASYRWDTPAGPSIVIAATLLFTIAFLLPGRRLH